MAFVEAVRERRRDARHHCFAWRLKQGDQGWRASDAGEPGGTAGMPILARIDGAELRGVVVVVTRYFGGTKLGKGGLIRAYGGAAAAVLDAGEVIEVHETRTVRIEHSYADQGAVQGVLRAHQLKPLGTHFDEGVSFRLRVPVEDVEKVLDAVRDATAGRVRGAPE